MTCPMGTNHSLDFRRIWHEHLVVRIISYLVRLSIGRVIILPSDSRSIILVSVPHAELCWPLAAVSFTFRRCVRFRLQVD